MLPISSGVVRLAAHQAEHQLMIALEQPGRIDHVGAADRVEDVGDRRLAPQHLRRIDGDVEFRHLPALHQHRRDAVQPVQPRLDLVGRELPEVASAAPCPTSGCSR